MINIPRKLAVGAIWTMIAFALGQLVRVVTNIILTRMLAPELFGIMVIVNTFKVGAELISDLAIGQNIVRSNNADNPLFLNSAWTLQVMRGILLWLFACAAAFPLGWLYESPIIYFVLPVASLVFVFSGFTSLSPFLAQRRFELAKYARYEILITLGWSAFQISLAYLSPTIWALVFGLVAGSVIAMVGSYLILPGQQYNFILHKQYAFEIFGFAKWIMVSSTIYFFSMSFDRLFLAGVVQLGLLGVYGIARSISELLTGLVLRLGAHIVFPFVASSSQVARPDLRSKIAPIRVRLLVLAAIGLSGLAAGSDLFISAIFDQRYHAVGWILPFLIIGSWFSIICNLNESTLLGLGRPFFGAVANLVKLGWLLIALPASFNYFGFFGFVLAVATSELYRYPPILIGQLREGISFFKQDVFGTILFFGLLAFWIWIRGCLGYGVDLTSFG